MYNIHAHRDPEMSNTQEGFELKLVLLLNKYAVQFTEVTKQRKRTSHPSEFLVARGTHGGSGGE